MILRERLAELLAKQDIGEHANFKSLLPEWQEEYRQNADAIIAFFVEAIRSLEFNANKNKP